MSTNGCSIRVYGHNQPFGGAWCSKPARVEVNGKHYCATHDPDAVLRRKQKADAKYHAEAQVAQQKHAAQKEMRRRGECYPDLMEALEAIRKRLEFDCSEDAVEFAEHTAIAAIAKAKQP